MAARQALFGLTECYCEICWTPTQVQSTLGLVLSSSLGFYPPECVPVITATSHLNLLLVFTPAFNQLMKSLVQRTTGAPALLSSTCSVWAACQGAGREEETRCNDVS